MSLRPGANFPVMTLRYPKPIRDDVSSFVRIVHVADQLAGNPLQPVEERRSRLMALERALAGLPADLWSPDIAETVGVYRAGLERHGMAAERSLRIVAACRTDLEAQPPARWSDVLAYCQQIAAPVGRQLLILNAEDVEACGAASDALWTATRVLDKLCEGTDASEPFQRLCIPLGFLQDACITIPHLRAPTARGQTRAVIYRVLDGVERLLNDAEPLIRTLRTQPLRTQSAVHLERARLLAGACRRGDPLQARIMLSGPQRWRCAWRGWRRSRLAP